MSELTIKHMKIMKVLIDRISGLAGFMGLLRKLPVHPENLVYPVDSSRDIFP